MTGLQLAELIFSIMSGIGGIGSVIVEIKKSSPNGKDEKEA